MKELQEKLNKLFSLEILARDTYSKILKDIEETEGELNHNIISVIGFIRNQEINHITAVKKIISIYKKAEKRKISPKIEKDTLNSLKVDFMFRKYLINAATSLMSDQLESLIFLHTAGEESVEFKEKEKNRKESIFKVAHQLKTPLTVSNWISETLMNKRSGELTEEQNKMVKEIRNANKSMLSFVNDLVDVYRVESEENLEMEKVNFTEVLQEVLKELSIVAKNMEKELIFKTTKEKLNIKGNKGAIKEIIYNLLINALHYSRKNDKILVELKKKDKKIIFSVSDYGIGIPKEDQDKVFKKFFRASNAKKIHPEGTGLGLYIIKELTEKLKGKIWFKSKKNKGTTFFVEFPVL